MNPLRLTILVLLGVLTAAAARADDPPAKSAVDTPAVASESPNATGPDSPAKDNPNADPTKSDSSKTESAKTDAGVKISAFATGGENAPPEEPSEPAVAVEVNWGALIALGIAAAAALAAVVLVLWYALRQWQAGRTRLAAGIVIALPIGLAWCVALIEWLWIESWRQGQFLGISLPDGLAQHSKLLLWPPFAIGAAVALVAAVAMFRPLAAGLTARAKNLILTLAYLPLWQFLVFAAEEGGNNGPKELAWLLNVRATLTQFGTVGLFVIGLAWVIWFVERASRRHELRRQQSPPSDESQRIWNPFDPNAWYYGRNSKRLSQSLATFLAYSVSFLVAFRLLTMIGGCQERFEMPAGGGEEKQIAQQVKIQKVIKKRYVINPFSAILFNPPPIDDIKLQLNEVTQHQYKIGQGAGDGAGFSGGTSTGKVRFIRLEYPGGDWNQDFGVGADVNMLVEYRARTGQTVADTTEFRTINQLARAAPDAAPPFVYLTGQKDIAISKADARVIREYLLNKHGMLFGDNGGSTHFHNQFFQMMRLVLPNVEPVRVALDDPIHMRPYRIPFLPYVAPHGGKDAWGWKVDGRWVCYYHPGDIGDAWSDGHAGIKAEITEFCYQLGTNVMFYAYAEYNKWKVARKQPK